MDVNVIEAVELAVTTRKRKIEHLKVSVFMIPHCMMCTSCNLTIPYFTQTSTSTALQRRRRSNQSTTLSMRNKHCVTRNKQCVTRNNP